MTALESSLPGQTALVEEGTPLRDGTQPILVGGAQAVLAVGAQAVLAAGAQAGLMEGGLKVGSQLAPLIRAVHVFTTPMRKISTLGLLTTAGLTKGLSKQQEKFTTKRILRNGFGKAKIRQFQRLERFFSLSLKTVGKVY